MERGGRVFLLSFRVGAIRSIDGRGIRSMTGGLDLLRETSGRDGPPRCVGGGGSILEDGEDGDFRFGRRADARGPFRGVVLRGGQHFFFFFFFFQGARWMWNQDASWGVNTGD